VDSSGSTSCAGAGRPRAAASNWGKSSLATGPALLGQLATLLCRSVGHTFSEVRLEDTGHSMRVEVAGMAIPDVEVRPCIPLSACIWTSSYQSPTRIELFAEPCDVTAAPTDAEDAFLLRAPDLHCSASACISPKQCLTHDIPPLAQRRQASTRVSSSRGSLPPPWWSQHRRRPKLFQLRILPSQTPFRPDPLPCAE
jgi:hypothetical protein